MVGIQNHFLIAEAIPSLQGPAVSIKKLIQTIHFLSYMRGVCNLPRAVGRLTGKEVNDHVDKSTSFYSPFAPEFDMVDLCLSMFI